MASLERQVAADAKRAVRSPERGAHVIVGNQALERVADHGGELEFSQPGRVRCDAFDPFDIVAPPGPGEREAVRVEADQTPGMTMVAGAVKHQPGTATDVKNRASG